MSEGVNEKQWTGEDYGSHSKNLQTNFNHGTETKYALFPIKFVTPPSEISKSVSFSYDPSSILDGSLLYDSHGEGAISISSSWDLHIAIEGSDIFDKLHSEWVNFSLEGEYVVAPPYFEGLGYLESASLNFSPPYLKIGGANYPSRANASISTIEYPTKLSSLVKE